MPLEIPDEPVVKRRPKKASEPKKTELDISLLSHPRVVHPSLSGDEFVRLKTRGILTFYRSKKPPKFKLFCQYARKDEVKKIPFAGWSKKNKCWVIPISIESMRHVARLFPGFMMTPDAFKLVVKLKKQAKIESELLRELQAIKKGEVSSDFIEGYGKFQPRPEQKICINACETAWAAGYGFGNFCEQGLGKTCMSLVAFDRYLEHCPDAVAVVYAPQGILYTTWVSDTQKFCKNVRPFVPTGSVPKRAERAEYTQQYDYEETYYEYDIKRTRMTRKNGRPNLFLINHECGRRWIKDDEGKDREPNVLIQYLERMLKEAGENSILIIDEVDKFSNAAAKQTKAAAVLANAANNVLCMTGTPGMPEKYYGILQLIDKRIFYVNKTDFMFRYTESMDLGERSKITGYKNLEELQRRADQFSIRYKQEDVGDIPEWQRVEVKIPMAPAQAKAYEAIADQIEVFYEEHNITKESLGAKLHGLRNVCSGFVKNDEGEYVRFKKNPKLDRLLEDLEEELATNPNHPEHVRKAFIVCQYKEDVAIIREAAHALSKKDTERGRRWRTYGLTVVTGDVKDTNKNKARTEAVLSFRQDPNLRIFIATESAISHGHHLVPELPMVCDVGYIYSSGYRPDSRDQVIKRIIRHGQTRSVRFKELLMEGTIDETIADCIQSKQNVCRVVNGDNLRTMLRGRSR